MTPARLAHLVTLAELPLILLIAPALLLPTPTRLLALSLVPILWLAARADTGRAVPSTPLNTSVVLLLVMVAVSLLATADVQASLGKVSGVVLGALFFWAVVRLVTNEARLRIALLMFLCAGTGLALAGLFGTEGSAKIPGVGALALALPQLIRGLPGAEHGFNTNAIAGTLVLFLPLQIALLVSPATRQAWTRVPVVAQLLMATTTGSVLLLMQSRGAFAGLAVSGISVLLWRRRTRMLAGAALAVLALTAITVGPQRMFALINNRVDESGRGRPNLEGAVSGREQLWERALFGIDDFAITGMGMNGFRRIVPSQYPILDAPIGFDLVHAHNDLLQAALDVGVVGLVAYTSLWLGAATVLLIVYRGTRDGLYRTTAGGLGVGLIAHFVFGVTDTIALGAKMGVAFWFVLAMAVALHQVAVGRTRVSEMDR